ncbi:hypothetical protein NQ314_016572 [Rhamnusium bicolor]|uniref:Uncharacterized protein n=1 Tax=Rhamnusium bicolor TaxID=1586634 RepID=A0AAV8WVL5_9CUCU|nr:hypothetical protein NQ314_016572 [Rhamnusium bicolor]
MRCLMLQSKHCLLKDLECLFQIFLLYFLDGEGIKLFAFHGKINEEMEGREAGTFSRDILKAKNGRWTFSDKQTKLKIGDILYYWTYVEYFDGQRKLGYPKDDQMFVVKELIAETDISSTTTATTVTSAATTRGSVPQTGSPDGSCEGTDTTINNGRKSCKGKLIFTEPFDAEMRNKLWTIDQKFAGAPDYEFVIYVNNPQTLNITSKHLSIKPVLIETVYGDGFVTRPYDLGENCTGVTGSPDCRIVPDAGFILPPVLSSRIHTKGKFSFKYGKIEIKAKLPKGDWIYPELYLNSVNDDYGLNYDSGQIRIAFTPGNANLNTKLEGGIILGSNAASRSYGIKSVEKRTSWTNEYHRFGLNWKPDSITVSVDDKVYGTIYPPTDGFASLGPFLKLQNAERWKTGTNLAPFDKEVLLQKKRYIR